MINFINSPNLKLNVIKAVRDHCVSNNLTPHLLIWVDTAVHNVPQAYVRDNQLVLNVSKDAVIDFDLNYEQELISFSASFNQIVHNCVIPISRVVAVYVHETIEGVHFDFNPDELIDPETLWDTINKNKKQTNNLPSYLKIIK